MQLPPAVVLGYGVQRLIDERWGTDALRDASNAPFPLFMRRRLKRTILEVTLAMGMGTARSFQFSACIFRGTVEQWPKRTCGWQVVKSHKPTQEHPQ